MAPAGRPRAPLLPSAVVLSLVFGLCLSSGEEYRLCSVSCCTVEPSCNEALRVTCDCPQLDVVTLGKADMPPSVEELFILNASVVIISSDAISSLPSLANFGLRGINNVTIDQDGMALREHRRLGRASLEDIGTLRIKSRAFSGVWEQRTRIEMRRIARLHVESNAFHYNASKPRGPSLMMQNVELLALSSKAFDAPVAEMLLTNVVMEACHSESFGGRIRKTKFHNVSIAEAKDGCVTVLNSKASLSIQSSKIEVVHPQAFSGQLFQLTINNSDFLTMHERSFNLLVRNMVVSGFFIRHLNSLGLTVSAEHSIQLEKVRVNLLSKSAFAGLKIAPSPAGFRTPLVIDQLEILEAERGSLAFSECVDVRMTDLDVVAPSSGLCPTERLVRALSSEGNSSGPLSHAQLELFWQLYEKGHCDDEDDAVPFPVTVSRPHCHTSHSDSDASSEDGEKPAPSKKTVDLSRGNNHRGLTHRDGNGNRTDGSSVIKGASPLLASFEVKISEEDQQNEGNNSEGPTVEYLVGYESFEPDVQTREQRGTKAVTDIEREDASSTTPSAASSVQPPTNDDNGSVLKAPRGATGKATLGGEGSAEADRPTAAPGGRTHHDRLLLYIVLGAIAVLISAMAGVCLMLTTKRRRRRRRDAAAARPVETMLMVLANRLAHHDTSQNHEGGDGRAGDRAGQHTATSSSARPPTDAHQYEPIREDLLLPPPLVPAQAPPLQTAHLIFIADSSSSRGNRTYENLLEGSVNA